MADLSLRKHCDQRMKGMETERYSWWLHWASLAEYILPRRYRYLVTANQYNRGSPQNSHIIDSTGTIAARTCASGMLAGITSPTRPWFKLKIEGFDNDNAHPVNIWLAECERRMLRVFQESNFYNAIAVVYHDLVVFGTAVMLIYEDFDDVIRCFNPCAGEYYLANSDKFSIDSVYRRFTLTVSQVVQKFGIENCSQNIKNLYERAGASLTQEIVVAHALEPNEPRTNELPKNFPWRQVYWEWGSNDNPAAGSKDYLECKGFNEFPALCPRWDITSNDSYGRSPAMDALGDIKQLQQETKRKAQAIDKMVNPPLMADVTMKNQPASTLPGGVTYVTNMQTGGMKPIYEVQPRIQELMLDIKEIQERIKNIFFNDLFMMFQQLQAEPRSAAAIDARREEKLIMLGPVLERFQNEALDPAIERVFNIMLRAQLFPPPPMEIQGEPIEVEYVSMLAEAQRAVATSGMERIIQIAGSIGAVKPEVYDKLDLDEWMDEYADKLGVPPKIINDADAVQKIREARAKQAQAQQEAQLTMQAVQGGKVLSETNVGGGQSALQGLMQGQQ